MLDTTDITRASLLALEPAAVVTRHHAAAYHDGDPLGGRWHPHVRACLAGAIDDLGRIMEPDAFGPATPGDAVLWRVAVSACRIAAAHVETCPDEDGAAVRADELLRATHELIGLMVTGSAPTLTVGHGHAHPPPVDGALSSGDSVVTARMSHPNSTNPRSG